MTEHTGVRIDWLNKNSVHGDDSYIMFSPPQCFSSLHMISLSDILPYFVTLQLISGYLVTI